MKFKIIAPILFVIGLLGIYVLLDAGNESSTPNQPSQSAPAPQSNTNFDFKR